MKPGEISRVRRTDYETLVNFGQEFLPPNFWADSDGLEQFVLTASSRVMRLSADILLK
jgi:hypothetical protein